MDKAQVRERRLNDVLGEGVEFIPQQQTAVTPETWTGLAWAACFLLLALVGCLGALALLGVI